MSLSFCWCGQVSSSLSQRLLFWYPNLNWKIRTRSRFKVDDHKYFILWGNQQLILQQEAWSCEKYLALGRFATSDKNPGNETHLEWGCFFFCLLLDLMIVSHNWFDFSTKKQVYVHTDISWASPDLVSFVIGSKCQSQLCKSIKRITQNWPKNRVDIILVPS